MSIPFWSVITLATELVVTASVYTIIWRAWRHDYFMWRFAFGVLLYELLFNVSYMFSRELGPVVAEVPQKLNPYITPLAIFHGIFSLVMFVALVTFFVTAWRAHKTRSENFFRTHPLLTRSFSVAWGISILSGITLFASLYII
ncbi:MAG: hypothetical protein B7X04_00745 [Parcubacteria group bacterium 21-54-25]|nr:MAG: hypothetical protein B7X04_00745 [Parcubacteria group bacterium 21-54-25]HQU07962.1 hypothetical protein [Candidatus Paceibacterota bacterium]